MAEKSVACRTNVAKARDMGMTRLQAEAVKGNISRGCRSKVVQLAPQTAQRPSGIAEQQATYQGLPLIGQKAADDPKREFMVELNRRFQALEARCLSLESVVRDQTQYLTQISPLLRKLQDHRKKAPCHPKKVSGDHPGMRGR